MIRLAFLALVLLLPGCRSDDPKTESNDPPAKPDQKALAIEKAELLNQKFELQQQLNQLIASTKLDPGNQLKAIQDATLTAQMNFLELRKKHPRLQKLNHELELWQRNLRSARGSGRATEASQAEAKLMQIRGEIAQISKTLPGISSIQDAISRKEREAKDLRRSLAEQSPEGKKIIDQITTLEARLQSL